MGWRGIDRDGFPELARDRMVRFRQSVEAQKHASDLLEKKFQEAVRKAKESPDTGKPIRDFDLD